MIVTNVKIFTSDFCVLWVAITDILIRNKNMGLAPGGKGTTGCIVGSNRISKPFFFAVFDSFKKSSSLTSIPTDTHGSSSLPISGLIPLLLFPFPFVFLFRPYHNLTFFPFYVGRESPGFITAPG